MAPRAAIAKHLHWDRKLQIMQVFISPAFVNRRKLGINLIWIIFLQFCNDHVECTVDAVDFISSFTLVDIKVYQKGTHRFQY